MSVLVTPRLDLLPVGFGDAAWLAGHANDRSMGWQRVGRGDASLGGVTRAVLDSERSFAHDGVGLRLVLLREASGPRAIGCCGLRFEPGLDDYELVVSLVPGLRGKGHATEASEATIDDALSRRGRTRVLGRASTTHEPWMRLLGRVGMRTHARVRIDGEEVEFHAVQRALLALPPP